MTRFRHWMPRRTLPARAGFIAARTLGVGLLALAMAATAGADLLAPFPTVPPFTIIDLGTLGGTNSEGNALNNLGQVAGASDAVAGQHAFLYDGAGMHDLGTLGSNFSIAYGINDAGQVVGQSDTAETATRFSDTHAFLSDNTGMHDLSTRAGLNVSVAYGINASGEVVGGINTRAFLSIAGVMQDLGTVGGAAAINDLGHIVGTGQIGPDGALQYGPYGAYLFDGVQLHYLGSFGASAINAADQVVGAHLWTAGTVHAALYDSAGLHDLGTLPAPFDYACSALGINAAGQIVGYASNGPGDGKLAGYSLNSVGDGHHACFWDGGQLHDLNDLIPAGSGWEILEARGINDRSQIAGVGRLATGAPNAPKHALLLSPAAVTPLVPPQVPSGLSAKLPTPPVFSELQLAWTDNSNNESGFEIERKANGSDWGTVAVTLPDSTGYLDTNLNAFTHYTYRVRAINAAGSSDWSGEASGDTGVRPATSGWSGLSFGSQPVGQPSPSQTLTITNIGNGPLTIGIVTLSGANAADFQITSPSGAGATVAPDGQDAITVVFTPSATGDRSAALTVTDNAPGSPHTVALTGAGTAPALKLSQASLDFGSQPVGLNGDLALLLQNTGAAPLTVSNIAFQGPDASEFNLAPGGWSGGILQPGGITLLNIRFLPVMTGSRSATLVITDSAADSRQPVSLTGIGTAPLLTLSADSLVFGLPSSGTVSASQTLILTNSGDAPLTIVEIGVAGPDAGRFKILSDSGEPSLAVGTSRSLTVTYTAATITSRSRRAQIAAAHVAAVSYNATLLIRDNDPHPNAPHSVALTALGADAPPPAATAPAAPTNLAAVVTPAPQVALTWTNNSSNETALAIWRQKDGGRFLRIGVVAPQTTHFTDAGMTPNTSYTYEVRATNNSGASPWSNLVTVVTPDVAPAGPTNLTATLTPVNQVALTWTVHSQNETALAIWRQTGGSAWVRVGVVVPQTTHFTDTSVAPSNTYTYEVRAINNSGASPWSNRVSAATLEAAPAAPTNLTATVGVGEIDLTWTSGKGNETGISIFRQVGGDAWQRIGVVVPSATHYADRSVQAGRSYRYQVRAHNSHFASAWTHTVTVLTPAAP